jgi:branched-chain amino acid transport system ATP-binding protein
VTVPVEAPPAATGDGSRPALLATEAVSKTFGGLVAVNDVSFSIPQHSIVSIIGPNGAGKTTFFNMLTGLYKPSVGRILFDGRDISRTARSCARRACGARSGRFARRRTRC